MIYWNTVFVEKDSADPSYRLFSKAFAYFVARKAEDSTLNDLVEVKENIHAVVIRNKKIILSDREFILFQTLYLHRGEECSRANFLLLSGGMSLLEKMLLTF